MRTIPTLSEPPRPGPTPYEDFSGADTIRRLREDAGLTWNGLARAIRRRAIAQGWNAPDGPGALDPATIKAIEKGHLPSLRKQLVLALFFGVDRRDIWKPENKRIVIRETERTAA